MESLTYVFEDRGLPFADDIDLQVDGLLRGRNLFKGWETEPSLFSSGDANVSMGYAERGFPETARKSVLINQCLENSSQDCDKPLQFSSTIVSKEFCPRYSSPPIKSIDNHKFVLNGLEIEKVPPLAEASDKHFSKENSVLSSPESVASAKRARVSGSLSQIPMCQVLGCNKDLSSSKEYHKRHKVCEVHSKTAVVIVNGIRQRFCQQCSRFHVLAEFDEGKRSCRKRLAGHNERRRKPHLDALLGSTFLGTDISRTSLFFSTIDSDSFFSQQCDEPITQHMHIKLEESSQISQSPFALNFGPSFPKSILHLHGMGNQYPSKNCLNGPSPDQELYAASKSSGALSLLSVRPLKAPRTSAGISKDPNGSFGKSESKKCIENAFDLSNGFDQGEFSMIRSGVQSGLSQELNATSSKCNLSPEGASTLDLFQLSVHLQRIERQKYSNQVEVGR